MTSYKVMFNGTNEDVEQMIRIMDKLFRRWYNVYGGKREKSWRDNKGYHVIMRYTAGWNDWWMQFEKIYLGTARKIMHMMWIDENSYFKACS